MKKKSTRDMVQSSNRNRDYVPEERPVRLEIKVPSNSTVTAASDETPISAPQGRTKTPQKTKRRKDKEKKSLPAFFKSKIFWGCASLAAALLIAFVGMPLMAARNSEMVTVAVAAQRIPEGMKLESSMLQQKEICKVDLPADTITAMEKAVGKYSEVTLLAGDVLTAAKVGDTYFEDTYLYDLPEGKMAMSVELANMAQSVSGKIRGGDVVRIYAVFNDAQHEDGAENADYAAGLVDELQYVEVLAATNNNVQDLQGKEENTGETETKDSKSIATVTLLVNHEQASILAGLSENATLYAALVVRGDAVKKQAALETMDNFFEAQNQMTIAASEQPTTEGGVQ